MSEHDDFVPGDNIFNSSTMSAGSLGSNNNISGAQAMQRQIISMEDDEVADDSDIINGKFVKMCLFFLFIAFFLSFFQLLGRKKNHDIN